ncbi:hydrocarbon-binding protein [Nostoc sp. 106C]|uniref:hydrocarbon-binding protein n=1 Tax=Nostoc sp. 106C TaxID=1932667 RepID=UPI000A3CA550|nr:hydrocarbon-binding protein [Nostoc sp. 106C]OUL17838.1 hydrocarbon-binding protein [Nostoc sp. 106C]OUL30864.1 hydrocarbon-binding protein [Nostoc sp. RF31YmG]
MLRPTLGDFSSIVCFKAAIVGMEEALGEKATAIALTTAGRSRGKHLAQELGLVNTTLSLDDVAYKLGLALGKEGTRLCIIDRIKQEGDTIKILTSETLCCAGEVQGSNRKCTYTLGAIWGALEQATGKRFMGKHTESVLRGSSHDVFEFTEL